MEKLIKSLSDLIKAIKAEKLIHPAIPTIKQPAPPSMTPNIPNKMPGVAPEGKKDPRKIAQQLKNGEMSTKTQKIMLKTAKNGQWTLESDPKANI
jgi:hypothetical protein